MNNQEVIECILDDIRSIEKQGKEIVNIEALKSYLVSLKKDTGDSDSHLQRQQNHQLATLSAENNRYLKQIEMSHERDVEMFRSVMTAGQSALKASMIINGGAAVTLTAFIGNIWGSKTIDAITSSIFALPVLLFCLGILFSAVASGTTYLSQFFYSCNDKKWMLKTGVFIHLITTLLVISSYVFFGWASYEVFKIFGMGG